MALRIDSVIRAAALPVGAARAMFNAGLSCNKALNNLVTVVVLPVPGPPVIRVKPCKQALAAAIFCQSGLILCVAELRLGVGGNNTAKVWVRAVKSTGAAGVMRV